MFLEYFGLAEQPFGVTPDPRFLYLDPGHREALASLCLGLEADRGFLTLIAPPGMGKTTLLFRLLEPLKASTKHAFIFQTQCDSSEFLRYLATDLGIQPDGHDVVRLHKDLREVVTKEAAAGRRFVLMIDEAQNLEEPVLETIRLLSNFETPNRKLMQIILSGQPQLAEKLARPGLEQLRQRISMLCRLSPLSPEETASYINHRLYIAGYQGEPLFSRTALALIASASRGIPRNINNLCFNALSMGCGLDRKRIDGAILREVINDLGLAVSNPRHVALPETNASTRLSIIPGLIARLSWLAASLPQVLAWFRPRWAPALAVFLLAAISAVIIGKSRPPWRFVEPKIAVPVSSASPANSPRIDLGVVKPIAKLMTPEPQPFTSNSQRSRYFDVAADSPVQHRIPHPAVVLIKAERKSPPASANPVEGTVPAAASADAPSSAGANDRAKDSDETLSTQKAKVVAHLDPAATLSPLRIQNALPGAEVFLDVNPLGNVAADGTFSALVLSPGEHTIELREPHHKTKQITKEFRPGEAVQLSADEVAMGAAIGTLWLNLSPPDAQVTVVRSGESQPQTVSQPALDLPEGFYTLTARKPGYVPLAVTVLVVGGETQTVDLQLTSDKDTALAGWEDPSDWTPDGPWFVHRGGNFVLFRPPSPARSIALTLKLLHGRRLQWVVNHLDDQNYVLFQIDEKFLYRSIVKNGVASEFAGIPYKLAQKSRDATSTENSPNSVFERTPPPIGRIASQRGKKNVYTLRIDIASGSVTHCLFDGEKWLVLDTWNEPNHNPLHGEFGLLIPGGNEVAMSNFSFWPE